MSEYEDFYSLSMDGMVAVVTGGGKGIGKEIALAYLEKGAQVVILDLAFDSGDLVKLSKQSDGKIVLFQGDATKEDEVKDLIAQVYQRYGKITHLINNVGSYVTDNIVNLSEDKLDMALKVNLFSSLFTVKQIIPIMENQNFGFVINMASVAAFFNGTYSGPYNMCKAAIVSFTKTLAKEYRDYNINVNAICPGLVDTEMISNKVAERAPVLEISFEDYKKELIKVCEQKSLINPKEVAAVALFLGSKMAIGITGTAIMVTGRGLIL